MAKRDLNSVLKLINQGDVNLNARQRWTETEGRGFYDKSWDWFDISALMGAAIGGYDSIVEKYEI